MGDWTGKVVSLSLSEADRTHRRESLDQLGTGQTEISDKFVVRPPTPVFRLTVRLLQVTSNTAQVKAIENRAMHQEPGSQPTLSTASALPIVDDQITVAEDIDATTKPSDRQSHPFQDVPMSDIDGRQPRRGRFGENDRDVKSPGPNHDGSAPTRSPEDRDAVRPAGVDVHVLPNPAGCSQDDRVSRTLPESDQSRAAT